MLALVMTDRLVSVRQTAWVRSATKFLTIVRAASIRRPHLFLRILQYVTKPNSPLRTIVRISFALCLLFGVELAVTVAPAAAQMAPAPSPVALTKVALISENANESHFQLTLAPRANPFQALTNDPRDPALALALATRSASAAAPRGLNGLVRSVQFVQAEGVLVLHFIVNTNATITASRNGDQLVDVVVSNSSGANHPQVSEAAAGPNGTPQIYGPPGGQQDYQLVLLKYADVSEVVGLLTDGSIKSNDVFIPEEPQFGSNGLTGSGYQPQPTSQAPGKSDEPLGESINASIAIDRRLNAVWLRGSPDDIARLKAMIAMIDIPVDSVILETQMVELTETGSKALGIDFTNANGQLGVATFQTGQFIPPGIQTGDHLTSVQFQAALYAQIQKGNGRIVSKPRIAAQSGSTAKIITGDALPILTAITLSGVNGVSQQVQYVNVGVTLQIAPRVSADGYVTSHVYAVVSSVTDFRQGYPEISQRQAETSATVRDGDSFVIGGLTQDENINNSSKIPILGDIPILGQAFRKDTNTRTKTELYIIVTPHIVHRVGTQALATARQEPFDSQPVTTVPAANGEASNYPPPAPPGDVPVGNPLQPPH
jgi:general secretion pathway protein D